MDSFDYIRNETACYGNDSKRGEEHAIAGQNVSTKLFLTLLSGDDPDYFCCDLPQPNGPLRILLLHSLP